MKTCSTDLTSYVPEYIPDSNNVELICSKSKNTGQFSKEL
jgi:hypothetical protein